MTSLYNDKYRNWFKSHWIRNQYCCPLSKRYNAHNIPNYNKMKCPLTNAHYRGMQQHALNFTGYSKYAKDTLGRRNEQGVNNILKNLEQEALTQQDNSLHYKRLADELSKKLIFCQNSLLTQQNKINVLEQSLKELDAERQKEKREGSSIAMKNPYRQKRNTEDDVEQKQAMISLLEGNSRLLDRNYNICKKLWFQQKSDGTTDTATEQRLKQLKDEKDRIKATLLNKRKELNKLRQSRS